MLLKDCAICLKYIESSSAVLLKIVDASCPIIYKPVTSKKTFVFQLVRVLIYICSVWRNIEKNLKVEEWT